jgi:hypothetical protein
MKKVCPCTILIILIAVALISSGCVAKQPKSDQNQNTSAQSQSTQNPDLIGSKAVNDPILSAAMKVMAQLGYDTAKLTFESTLMKGLTLQWMQKFSDADGDVATLVIDEASLKPVMFFTGRKVGDIVPPTLRTGQDIPSQIATALGLETLGFKRVTWLPGLNTTEHVEYRKYAMSGQLEIAVSQVTIMAPASPSDRIAINWRDRELMPGIDIKVPREDAISMAAAFLHVSKTEPTHVDLFQFETNPLNPTGEGAYIVWEIVMGGKVARVRVDNGKVMSGTETTLPPPPPV